MPARRLTLVLLGLLAAAPAHATERVVRVFDEQRGLTVSETFSLAQDSSGFVWIGTVGGLFRFDGREVRPWAPERIAHVTALLSAGPGHELIAGGYFEPLWRVTDDGAEPLAGPDGQPIRDWLHATYARDGALWVLWRDRLARRTPDGAWHAVPLDTLRDGGAYRVMPAAGSHVYYATYDALFDLAPDGSHTKIAPFANVIGVAVRPDGQRVVLTREQGIWFERHGRFERFDRGPARGNAMVLRGDVVWATIESHVIAFRPGAAPETLTTRPEVATGRPLLVDREGSLWIGGFRGVMQCPEPETVTWSELDGLPSPPHGRFVTRSREGVWLSTWAGLARLDAGAQRRVPRIVDSRNRWRVVRDGLGRVWTGGLYGIHERTGGDRLTRCDLAGDTLLRMVAAGERRDGTAWLSTSSGLYLTAPGDRPPRPVTAPPPPEWYPWPRQWVADAIEDRAGQLWVTDDEHICHASADSVARGLPVAWQCDSVMNVESVTDLLELPSGSLWLGTSNGGVWRRRAGRWEPIPGSAKLASQRAQFLTLSPSGGVWIAGSGVLTRVEERLDRPEGWRVLESPTAWDGVPNPSAGEVSEEADGTLWIASLAGLTRVPPVARFVARPPPAVQLVDVLVDGQRRPIDAPLKLPFRRNRVELHFAAMSFRDPSLVRYEVRLKPSQPWTESHSPEFRFVDLSPGHYAAEVRASLDGERWSAAPTRVAFVVLRPWWLEWWALLIAVVALLGALYAAYKIRVNFLLGLERQRARIAMDLHDEMGSGLGSIGLLAGLVAQAELDEPARRRLAAQIADAAGELGGALSDIVWSLRADAGTLESLGVRVAERAARLFPDESVTLVTSFPATWPRLELPLGVRRNLQLIAAESLHNAARHARARRVEIGLEPAGGRWRLWVEDDGCGLPAALAAEIENASRAPASARVERTSGNGLRNLRARARAIGATIRWSRPASGGTRVEIEFDPRPRDAAGLA